MISSVIGGAMLPHAPQFFTMPETEDRDTVERVKTAAAEIGTQLRALRPDLWIFFANDHVEQFFHTAAPPFTIHVGDEAKGEFAFGCLSHTPPQITARQASIISMVCDTMCLAARLSKRSIPTVGMPLEPPSWNPIAMSRSSAAAQNGS